MVLKRISFYQLKHMQYNERINAVMQILLVSTNMKSLLDLDTAEVVIIKTCTK